MMSILILFVCIFEVVLSRFAVQMSQVFMAPISFEIVAGKCLCSIEDMPGDTSITTLCQMKQDTTGDDDKTETYTCILPPASGDCFDVKEGEWDPCTRESGEEEVGALNKIYSFPYVKFLTFIIISFLIGTYCGKKNEQTETETAIKKEKEFYETFVEVTE